MNKRTRKAPSTELKQDVLSYQFVPLIHHMMDRHYWLESRALKVFEALKQFLFISGTSVKGGHEGPFMPPPEVDDMWHEFMVHSKEYHEFCQRYFGIYIHHLPTGRRVVDVGTTRRTIKKTIAKARRHFGQLSSCWDFPSPASNSAGAACESCGVRCSD